MNEENTEWYKKGYEQAEADQEALIKKFMQDIIDLNNARMSLLEDIGLIDLCDSSAGIREAVILECVIAATKAPEPDAWDVAEHIAKSFGYAVVEDDTGIRLNANTFYNGVTNDLVTGPNSQMAKDIMEFITTKRDFSGGQK